MFNIEICISLFKNSNLQQIIKSQTRKINILLSIWIPLDTWGIPGDCVYLRKKKIRHHGRAQSEFSLKEHKEFKENILFCI